MSATDRPVTVCFPFIGDLLGGSHLSALGLIRNLARSRFTPLVVLHHPDGPVADIFRREAVPFEGAPDRHHLARRQSRGLAAAVTIARSLPAMVGYLRDRAVGVVHTNDGRTHLTWGLAARLAGSKHLWHHRNDASSFGLRRVAPWLPDRVVAVSKFASPRPGLVSAARKSSVVYSPFDVDKLDDVDRSHSRRMVLSEIGCSPDTWLVGYVGTLVERKRPLMFVESIAALKRIAPHVNVAGVFIGNSLNDLDQKTRSRAQDLGIGGAIHNVGFRYPGEPWIAALDTLLVPAVDEPLGRTLVEAMLLGTPVVAAASGGNPEAIEDGQTGLLVTPDQPDEFAKACLRLIQDAALGERIGEAAASRARTRFSVERHVQEIEGIYEGLLGTGTKQRRAPS